MYPPELALYKDKDRQDMFDVENLGITDAGKTKTMTGYLANNTQGYIHSISYETGDDSVTLLNLPGVLKAYDIVPIKIVFASNSFVNDRRALHTWVSLKGKLVTRDKS